jgi:hypothetical protein
LRSIPRGRVIEPIQAQIDGGGIQRIDAGIQVDARCLLCIQRSGTLNQAHGQGVIDAPIAKAKCVRQGGAGGRSRDAHVEQLGLIGVQANFDTAKRLAPRQLRKDHHKKQFGATQGTRACIAEMALDDAAKGLPRHIFHDLRKKRLDHIHASPCLFKPTSIANVQNEIQIMDIHENLETPVVIGFGAFDC